MMQAEFEKMYEKVDLTLMNRCDLLARSEDIIDTSTRLKQRCLS